MLGSLFSNAQVLFTCCQESFERLRTDEAAEENATNDTEYFNARVFWTSFINKLIARDTLMNHIPKAKFRQGPVC